MSSQFAGFNDDRAKSYDERVRKHIPGYEILHGLAETMLAAELPNEASILAVGTGTGVEMLEWAPKHPGWNFVGTDNAEAMLGLAESKLAAAGLTDRVKLHLGDIEDLPEQTFDAATMMLMMHFVPEEDKFALFGAVADRVKPGGPLLIANLFGDPTTTRYKRMNDARKAWAIARGLTPEMAEEFCDPNRPDIHVVPEEKLKSLLRDTGWIDVQRVYQALTVGLWFARRPR